MAEISHPQPITETKLAYLLTRFLPEQREELCARMGITRETFYRRRNNPGSFTLDEGAVLANYLEELHGHPVDLFQLLKERVEVLTNNG